MAKAYVKFEPSNEVVAKTYEAVRLAKQSGKLRKGANEVTKSIERGIATFVVIASDVEPEEIVMHLPGLCEGKKIPFTYVTSKLELGKAIGMNVNCTAIAIEGQGDASQTIKDIISRTTGAAPKEAKPKEEKKEEKKAEMKK